MTNFAMTNFAMTNFAMTARKITRLESVGKKVAIICVLVLVQISQVYAQEDNTQTESKSELEWGAVLFEYFQKDYFKSLIEYDYTASHGNPIAKSAKGQLLNGGMLLSFGLADQSKKIFDRALKENAEPIVRNRVWYYLANLYYHKSNQEKAFEALNNIQGQLPSDLHSEYHYLATLVENPANHLQKETLLNSVDSESHYYPYILFNMAIQFLRGGDPVKASELLQKVTAYSEVNSEFANLADRAKHGLAQLFLQQGQNQAAWLFLTSIRTTGLYSNRALLTYAWTAIKLKQFQDAVAALEILNTRSIAMPEVQEAKVLLAHLYEQEGAKRKALKANLMAIEDFEKGISQVAEARRIIAKREVPKEFVLNLEAIIQDSDWFGTQPTVDYAKLTPFMVDLTASKVMNETLKELSELYSIQRNLQNWQFQTRQHQLIIQNVKKKQFSDSEKVVIESARRLKEQLEEQKTDLRLHSLTLSKSDRKKLQALVENTEQQLSVLEGRIRNLTQSIKPYQLPEDMLPLIKSKHKEIQQKLKETEFYIAKLEPVVRLLVNEELDKHEERMRYYWAQSRLAKARLYDSTLMELDKSKRQRIEKSKHKDKEGSS
ncbi:lipopolysaccharide assembly protein LapB [Aliikangiella sp. G2MR2-5]|uniref:tetratricopeptide repeat protein n=1 Tax=Aliikangiella sp. G2MR2-5 TaxID=2788943 RepID=UPI001AEEFA04|nr:hypothetical protein [Aliikangiella sp. G2MR2-5]